jgi:DUF4097 and DUF4098 domain-containing protein YvlB
MTLLRTRSLPLAALLCAGLLSAQEPARKLSCDGGRSWGDSQRACDLHEQSIPVTRQLAIDASPNGGVAVQGWSRNEILVRAKVETRADTEAEAKALLSQVTLQTAGGRIAADGPRNFGGRQSWSVSFEVFVPVQTDLSAKTVNGGISLDTVSGDIGFTTVNGGVSLARVSGKVLGKTTNGGVNVTLEGARWEGDSLDVRTTNGGVNLTVPNNYSARLEAGTVHGGFSSDIPATVQGDIGKEISATLGAGGAPIRVHTTNGGIRIKKQS